MRAIEAVLLVLVIGTIFSASLIIKYQDKQIHDICLEYFRQVSKTNNSNPKVTEICFAKKFSINEYSGALNE